MSTVSSPFGSTVASPIQVPFRKKGKLGGVYGRVDAAPALPLDSLTAGAAYSVRRLRTDYTGPLLRVRRSSDNTEQDIGYGGDNWLDETALLTFVGAGSGFVVTWYDQSGNARDITQATTGSQPRLVNAGVTETLGFKPTAAFDGTDDHLFNTSPFLYAAGAATTSMVANITPQSLRFFASEGNSADVGPTYAFCTRSGGANDASAQIRNATLATVFDNAQALVSGLFNTGACRVLWKDTGSAFAGYGNGTLGASIAYTRSGAATFNRFTVGALLRTSLVFPITGKLSEAIFLPSAINDTDRAALDASQEANFFLAPAERLAQINGTGDGGSSLAVNLGGIADWEEPRFIDRAKQARGWLRPTFDAMPGANLDSLGRLASIPGGDTTALFFFSSASDSNGIVSPPTSRGGRFRAAWTGAANVSVSGGSNVTIIGSNAIEFDCDWIGNKWLEFTPTSYPISVSLVRTDLLSAHAAGDVIAPEYLSFLPAGGCYRFMDWMGTNNSSMVNFSDYPTISHQTWDRVPVDVMVELCNIKSADPWFCIPHQASDAFVNSFADQVLAGLDAVRKPRIELSNEIWNTGVFTQGAYFKSQAEAVWGVVNGYTDSAWLNYAAKRFCQVVALWKARWGGSQTRLIFVLGGQAANPSVASAVLTASMWRTYEPSDYVVPSTVTDEISIAPYINWTGTISTQGNTIKTALDISHAAAVQAVKDMIPASLAQSKTWINNHVSIAADRGCRLTMYEYNNHYDLAACSGSNLYSGAIPVAGALDAFVEATYSQDMADAQDDLRGHWKTSAGSLAAFFVENARFSRFGTWGAATHIGHNSAIWTALKAWHTANPRWWSQ